MLSLINGYFLGNNSPYIGGEHDQNIGSWFYYDCYLMGYLKNLFKYLNTKKINKYFF